MSKPKASSTAKYVAPFPAFERGDAFRDLSRLVRGHRRPLALVGAGASVGSGYPTWPKLLERLRDEAKAPSQELWRKNLEDIGDAPWTAEVFARNLPKGGLADFVARQFGGAAPPGEPHLTLAQMGFSHYLTTNYDSCIERSLTREKVRHRVVRWSDTQALSDFLMGLSDPRARTSVVYLHGRHDSAEKDIVLRERDYVARYIVDDDARRKLMAIFMTQPVVFVGFSMNDPDLANLMREVTARLRTNPPAHFALMGYKSAEEREVTRDRMTHKFGVRPIFFSRTPVQQGGDEYANLLLLLDALRGVAADRRPSTSRDIEATADPDDPHKSQFGGLAEANGRRLSVVKTGGSQALGNLRFELIVEALPGAPKLEDRVVFHLHPTFNRAVAYAAATDNRAVLHRWAYGAFTVGVEADRGETRLELDLAEQANLPLWFRRQ